MAEPPTTPNLERHKSVVMLENDDALQIVRTDLANLVATAAKTNSCDIEELRKHLVDFEKLFTQFLAHRKIGNNIIWSRIQPLQTENVHTYQSVVEAPLATTKGDLLDKLVVLKLNGGLGTSMGCVGPKSLISVRNDSTFLDLTVQLIECLNKKHNSDVPLVLMNSFNTHEETQRVRFKYDKRVDLHMFQQSYHPRVLRETLRPFPVNVDLKDGVSWYPPGHGDIYNSLKRSGLLERFLEEGKEFIFISNIDNLGATVDLGAEGQRGRVQVHQEVQGVQHQQPVGESESHQETAGRGDHEGGGHRQQEESGWRSECDSTGDSCWCCYQELQWSSRYQCSSESFPASEEDVGSAGGHVQPVPAERRDSGPEPSPALPRTTPRQTRRTLLHEGS
ncbi:UTP--glucose-1-phosphate uridylyltransferase [Geodia barretti]|uniref:UTP--glucose-1-phosphate uridylyltransferase n=1 Tax=Geodia barretti TaxID=519541 RepID=A0AA35THT2_GEOBA|nr:UTP--glucose-1-phosphate uridylyltransferase [Geodia barretti]